MEITRGSSAGSYQIRVVLGALFAAVVADGLITRFLVRNGLAREANPLLSEWAGADGFLTLKLAGGFLAALYLFLLYKRQPRLSLAISLFFLAAYTAVVFWNLSLLG